MADEEWVLSAVAPGQRGDVFAAIVEKRVAAQIRLHDGEYRTHWSSEATVVVRGSLARRRFFGGPVVNGYEHHVIVVDAEGGEPVVVIAHSRAEAPLQAIDVWTGQQRWVSADLRGAWALTASKRSRLFGACYRGSSKLVSADTGKYRWTWRGDVQPLIADGRYAVGEKRKSGTYTTELRDASDGTPLFARDGDWVLDAVVSGDVVVMAGQGLHAFRLDGTPLWRFEPQTSFHAIVTLRDGVRAYSPQRGIVDVRDGNLVRGFAPPCVADSKFLGPEHLLSKEGVWSIGGHEVWNFADELRECAKRAVADNGAAFATTPSTSAERVFHRRFGWGTVLQKLDAKMRVKFDDGNERTLAAEFLSTSE